MRKVIMTVGVVVAVLAYVLCIYGLVTTPDAHAVPTPDRLVAYGAVGMMAVTLSLVLAFSHGAKVGDQE